MSPVKRKPGGDRIKGTESVSARPIGGRRGVRWGLAAARSSGSSLTCGGRAGCLKTRERGSTRIERLLARLAASPWELSIKTCSRVGPCSPTPSANANVSRETYKNWYAILHYIIISNSYTAYDNIEYIIRTELFQYMTSNNRTGRTLEAHQLALR